MAFDQRSTKDRTLLATEKSPANLERQRGARGRTGVGREQNARSSVMAQPPLGSARYQRGIRRPISAAIYSKGKRNAETKV